MLQTPNTSTHTEGWCSYLEVRRDQEGEQKVKEEEEEAPAAPAYWSLWVSVGEQSQATVIQGVESFGW